MTCLKVLVNRCTISVQIFVKLHCIDIKQEKDHYTFPNTQVLHQLGCVCLDVSMQESSSGVIVYEFKSF